MSVSSASAQNGVVLGRGVERAVRERRDHDARGDRGRAPRFDLGDGVVDAGRGEDRLADQPAVGALAELGEPVVVRADARDLELGLGAVDLGARQRDARVQHLQVDAVDVDVGEAGLGVEAARAASPRSVTPAGLKSRYDRPAVGGEPDRAHALAVVERPDVAVVGVHHLRRTVPHFAGTRACHVSGGSLTCASASRIG